MEGGRVEAWEDEFEVEASMQSLNCISGGIRNILKKNIVKLRQGSGKDWQGMAPKAKGLKA